MEEIGRREGGWEGGRREGGRKIGEGWVGSGGKLERGVEENWRGEWRKIGEGSGGKLERGVEENWREWRKIGEVREGMVVVEENRGWGGKGGMGETKAGGGGGGGGQRIQYTYILTRSPSLRVTAASDLMGEK